MRNYRIVQHQGNSETWYTVEYEFSFLFFEFWISCKYIDIRGASLAKRFSSFEDAKDYIEKTRRNNKPKVTYYDVHGNRLNH